MGLGLLVSRYEFLFLISRTIPIFLTKRGFQVLGVSHNCLASVPACLDRLDLVVLRLEGNRSADYVVKDPATDLIVPGICIPRRQCDGLLQTKDGQAQHRCAFRIFSFDSAASSDFDIPLM